MFLSTPTHALRAFVISAFIVSISSVSSAANAAFDGWNWLQTTTALHAQFEQRTLDKSGEAVGSAAKGELWIQRPGKFRWRYDQPNQQLTVSNGKKISWYDPQLKQIVTKPVQGSLGNALAQLLTSDAKNLKTHFKSEQNTQPEGYSLKVTPFNADQEGFKNITLNWTLDKTQPVLRDIVILDGFGQHIAFKLTQVETPAPASLSSSLFSFTPPAGTSIVNEKL
ncbi:MAG: outer membrane lipoprotein chaperone LolA [Pseudomonadota bacterium]